MRRVFCYALWPTRLQLAGTLRDQTSVDGTWCRWRTGSCVSVLGGSSVVFSCVLQDSAVHTTATVARRCGWMSLAAHRSEPGVSCSSCGVYPWSGVSPWALHGFSQRVCGTTRHQQKPIGHPMTSMSGLFIECWIDTGRTESGARPRTWGTKGLIPAIRPRSIRVLRRSLPL